MVSQEEAKQYYLDVYNKGTIYVWGFNSGTTINSSTISQAYKNYGSSKYNYDYYQNKLKEGNGKNGSDCSGMHFPLSKNDMTAQCYYSKCKQKGKISTLPKDKIVILFKGTSTSNITHTGVYLGNGQCIHMKSSKENCVMEDVNKHNWTFWGIPEWIDYSKPLVQDYNKYTQESFLFDVSQILKTSNPKEMLKKSPTISTGINKKHALVTPLERYMKALGYYNGEIEADIGAIPVFGNGMKAAIKQYQREIVRATEQNCDGVITQNGATYKKLYGF